MPTPRLFLAAVLLAAGVQAQAPRELAPVLVLGERETADPLAVPAALDRIDARELARARARLQLSESLQRVPGVVVRDRQNQAQDLQISIRGYGARATFGVRGVRLYTDGIPATMPDGQGQVSHFALEAAERIEVLRGPFSALYGNASGGVIEVFSAPPPEALETAAGIVAGTNDLWRVSASVRGPWPSAACGSGGGRNGSSSRLGAGPYWDDGCGGYRLDAVRVEGDGYRAHSAYTRDAVQALLRGGAAATRWMLLANTLDLQAQDPQGLTAAELALDRRAASPNALRFDARKQVEQRQLGGGFEHDLGDERRLALRLHAGRRETAQMLAVPVAAQAAPSSGGGAIALERDYRGADLRWQLERGDFSLVTGLAAETADEHRRGFENFVGERLGVVGALRRDEDDRVDGFDQYLQLGWRPAQRWHLALGARHSRIAFATRDRYVRAGNPDDSGRLAYSRTTPVAGLLWRVTPTLSAYANAGRGFETPTFAELAYRNDGGSGLNTALEAARSQNFETGLRARGERHAWSAALFESRTTAELVVAANQGGRSVFANAGLSRRRGFEFAAQGELAPAWHYAASYTWLDARYRSDFQLGGAAPIEAGRRIPGLARHAAWAELRWSPRQQLDLMLEARAVAPVFADDGNRAAAPGYASFDLAAEHRFALIGCEARVFARIENLLDRDYLGSVIVNDANGRWFEPAPGRGFVLGLQLGHGGR
jgi:iron complex outermembrane receptor protein